MNYFKQVVPNSFFACRSYVSVHVHICQFNDNVQFRQPFDSNFEHHLRIEFPITTQT